MSSIPPSDYSIVSTLCDISDWPISSTLKSRFRLYLYTFCPWQRGVCSHISLFVCSDPRLGVLINWKSPSCLLSLSFKVPHSLLTFTTSFQSTPFVSTGVEQTNDPPVVCGAPVSSVRHYSTLRSFRSILFSILFYLL